MRYSRTSAPVGMSGTADTSWGIGCPDRRGYRGSQGGKVGGLSVRHVAAGRPYRRQSVNSFVSGENVRPLYGRLRALTVSSMDLTVNCRGSVSGVHVGRVDRDVSFR
jgi:hypothetical protein